MSSDFEKLVRLAGTFAMLSMLAVGGGTAVLPQMKHTTVAEYHWLTPEEFNNYYGIGQFVPGPNMLMVALIGKHVAGAFSTWGVGRTASSADKLTVQVPPLLPAWSSRRSRLDSHSRS